MGNEFLSELKSDPDKVAMSMDRRSLLEQPKSYLNNLKTKKSGYGTSPAVSEIILPQEPLEE